MEPRQISNNDVFISATEPILYNGCDFRLYWACFGTCFLLGICLFTALPLPYGLYAVGGVVALFIGLRWGLRELAKSDPLAYPVYLRHLKWPDYLSPLGKPLRKRKKFSLLKGKK